MNEGKTSCHCTKFQIHGFKSSGTRGAVQIVFSKRVLYVFDMEKIIDMLDMHICKADIIKQMWSNQSCQQQCLVKY